MAMTASEPKYQPISGGRRASLAVLLCRAEVTREDQNIARILDCFGVPCKTVTVGGKNVDESSENYALLSSADCMAELITQAEGPDPILPLPLWVRKASSVYLYGFSQNDRSTMLLRLLTANPRANVRQIQPPETTAIITQDFADMCGPMSGMRVPLTLRDPEWACDLGCESGSFQSVIRTDQGEVFFGVTFAGVRFYLSASRRTIDIGALAPEYFDVKKSFCESVPLVFYLKWAFRGASFGQSEINASLIVDDPPLKRRYGFLNFSEALDLMDRHNFATTIAFIPWNWRRTDPRTLRLFQTRPERLSVVVHGCDHTTSEFAERSPAVLNRKIRISCHRMERFRQRTACEADQIMVFPQGEFSPETGRALKLNGFVAAVNTEVAPAPQAFNKTTIADLWSLAIMRYGKFPIFTRRYLGHGIENFAFDALLGKPCLIAAHHEVFKDHARNLVDFIARLNSLRWNLVWRPLGEVIRRSFTNRRLDDGTSVIQMFAGSLVVKNPDAEARRMVVLKEEVDQECIQAVWVNQAPIEFSVEGGYLRFRLTVLPGETANVRVVYRNNSEAIADRNSSGTNIKVAAKRYLSEFRDNYLTRNDFLYRSATKLKRLMK